MLAWCRAPHPGGEAGGPESQEGGKSLPGSRRGFSPLQRPAGRASAARGCTAAPAAPDRGTVPRRERVNSLIFSSGVSPLKAACAVRLLSSCQRRLEQRHMPQSFTRRASRLGRGTARGQAHARTRTRTPRNLLQAPSGSDPNLYYVFLFLLLCFVLFCSLFFSEEQRLWGGLARLFCRGWCRWMKGGPEAGGGGGSRQLERETVPRFPGREGLHQSWKRKERRGGGCVGGNN